MNTPVYRNWIFKDHILLASFHRLSSSCVTVAAVAAMDSSNSSKSHRVRDFLPSVRPSFLSFMLVLACGYLWMKNETINDRLIALENRMNKFPLEVRVESGSPKENFEQLNVKPTTDSVETLTINRIDYTSGRNYDCYFAV